MQSLPPSSSAFDSGRAAEACLVAEFAGGRTMLRRQHVGYPWHVTRVFTSTRRGRICLRCICSRPPADFMPATG